MEAYAFVGSIDAQAPTRDAQVKAMSIEFFRQYTGGTRRQPLGTDFRDTGLTDPIPLIRKTQSIMVQKHVGRKRRAMNKTAKELGLNQKRRLALPREKKTAEAIGWQFLHPKARGSGDFAYRKAEKNLSAFN